MKKSKKFIIAIPLAVVLICLGIIKFNENSRECFKNIFLMDTIIDLKYYGKNSEKAMNESINKLREIDNNMSLSKSDSEMVKINNNAGKRSVKVNDGFLNVINKAIYYGRLSDGAFDISIRPVDKLWGIGTKNERIPKEKEIKENLKFVNYKNIETDNFNKTVFLRNKNMAIDLGGIAKGYAADELVKILKENNIKSGLINLGGNIYAYKKDKNDKPFNIGIQDPKEENGQIFAIIKVKNKSVVTSGNYERYFIKNGKRYHHIMDPRTGAPSESGIISSTIISDKSIDGDALSTATFILGVKKGMELINSLSGVEAIFVTNDNKVYTSLGLNNDNFKITNERYHYEKGR
ncbi:thiamine biosynthesis lipoprotein [Clostridium moniliforme]|uniref:FAD:protein FMN transferase n=1 Tax=Clostridium moniliforme TaxID=39489 RepID=A0ABS4F1N1_9CLOT|nr:FAD:protein FMN transferase [Clostridium moniliforme]MBP1890164.1 thiamine biosynthesis lipoprotein [Clostridium moniliforme]